MADACIKNRNLEYFKANISSFMLEQLHYLPSV